MSEDKIKKDLRVVRIVTLIGVGLNIFLLVLLIILQDGYTENCLTVFLFGEQKFLTNDLLVKKVRPA